MSYKISFGRAMRRLGAAFDRFFLTPASPRPLGVLRISLCTVLLVQGVLVSHELLDLYGRNGFIQQGIGEFLYERGLPSMSWIEDQLSHLGIGADQTVHLIYSLYMGSVAMLLLGWHTRLSALFAWFTHFILLKAPFSSAYGVDQFANIFLFFMLWMPMGSSLSLDLKIKGLAESPSRLARLSLRCIQLELCIIYLSAGLFKAMGIHWWNGNAMWTSLTSPLFSQVDMTWSANVPWLLAALGWLTLATELGYPIFMWVRKTRKVWLIGTIGLHFGIFLFLGLGSFAAVMIVLTFSAFGIDPEGAKNGYSFLSQITRVIRQGRPPLVEVS